MRTPMRLPMETEDPTDELPVPDVTAARSRGRAVPAVSSIAADATGNERDSLQFARRPGVGCDDDRADSLSARAFPDAATTVDARAPLASIRGSEHEGRAGERPRSARRDAATRVYPRKPSPWSSRGSEVIPMNGPIRDRATCKMDGFAPFVAPGSGDRHRHHAYRGCAQGTIGVGFSVAIGSFACALIDRRLAPVPQLLMAVPLVILMALRERRATR